MSSFHAQPDPAGSFSPENAPQVVVRAGKTFVCSACGTLVEIPAEVVGQLVLAVNPSPQPMPADKPRKGIASTNATMPGESASPKCAKVTEEQPVRSSSHTARPTRPKRPKQPMRESFVGQTIDGLRVPSANELDRALKWVSFHLRVLDRQGSEIKRLQKLLDNCTLACPGPRGHASVAIVRQSVAPGDRARVGHAYEDVTIAPNQDDATQGSAKERGPP